MQMRLMKLTVGLFVGSLLLGCESSKVVPASGPRPALQPSVVKIFQKAPKKYEKHGLVEVPVTGEVRWNAQGDATAGFERLKVQAPHLLMKVLNDQRGWQIRFRRRSEKRPQGAIFVTFNVDF